MGGRTMITRSTGGGERVRNRKGVRIRTWRAFGAAFQFTVAPPLRFRTDSGADMEPIIARLHSAVATASMKSAFAAKIDAILKFSILASVLLACCSVGYHYLAYLPRRNVQIEPQGALEDFRFAGASAQTITRVNTEQASKKTKRKPARRSEQHAEQEPPLFEQKVSEQPASEQKAIEQRQALEKADRYQACLSRATDRYNASRLAACNRP